MGFSLQSSQFDLQKHLLNLKEDGLTYIPNAYSKAECARYVSKCNAIMEKLIADKKATRDGDCRNIWNFFKHDPELLDLVYHPALEEILKNSIDEDFVLVAGNIINRQRFNLTSGGSNYADDWHTDSRYLGGQRLAAGFNFGFIVMLEDFTKENGATHFIRGTQKLRERPNRMGDYQYETLTGEAGTAVIFDSGVWHRGGTPSEKSRWGVFSMYGPWFMKPYFRFPEMLGEDFKKKLTPELKRLFHYDSIPPLDENERINTLVKKK